MWPFSSSPKNPEQQSGTVDSTFDSFVPPPPSGAVVPPPNAPKSFRGTVPTGEFKGFSPPPLSSSPSMSPSETPKKSSLLFTGFKSTSNSDYSSEDLSQHTSSVRESPGFTDEKYYSSSSASRPGLADQYITNPRARQCWESVKMGVKMGATVGSIFGGLTGIYASIIHRSPLLMPMSTIGGAVSFGFFLGCGMLVRCEEVKGTAETPAADMKNSQRVMMVLISSNNKKKLLL